MKCNTGCCILNTYIYNKRLLKQRKKRNKAGIFIYDHVTNKVLLVQSRGNLWGPPKGTIKSNETEKECAIREVKEETGLIIDINDEIFNTKINIFNNVYFLKDMPMCNVSIQKTKNNDVNGIGWININCLYDMIKTGKISVNYHCRLMFKLAMKIYLPYRI